MLTLFLLFLAGNTQTRVETPVFPARNCGPWLSYASPCDQIKLLKTPFVLAPGRFLIQLSCSWESIRESISAYTCFTPALHQDSTSKAWDLGIFKLKINCKSATDVRNELICGSMQLLLVWVAWGPCSVVIYTGKSNGLISGELEDWNISKQFNFWRKQQAYFLIFTLSQ